MAAAEPRGMEVLGFLLVTELLQAAQPDLRSIISGHGHNRHVKQAGPLDSAQGQIPAFIPLLPIRQVGQERETHLVQIAALHLANDFSCVWIFWVKNRADLQAVVILGKLKRSLAATRPRQRQALMIDQKRHVIPSDGLGKRPRGNHLTEKPADFNFLIENRSVTLNSHSAILGPHFNGVADPLTPSFTLHHLPLVVARSPRFAPPSSAEPSRPE